MSKVIEYYEHKINRPIYKREFKLVNGDIYQRYENGNIKINDVLVHGKEAKEKKKEKVIDLDINNDGKVDDKDYSLMGSAMGKRGAAKKKKATKSKKKGWI